MLQAGLGGTASRDLELSRAQRDADRSHTVLAHRVQHQAAPSASDIQQPLVSAQAQLAADEVELGPLRGVQVDVLVLEVRAGVRHGAIEKQCVELGRQVVVVPDRRRVARAGMAQAAQVRLRVARGAAARARAERDGSCHHARPAGRDAPRRCARHALEEGLERIDLELAGHVRAAERSLRKTADEHVEGMPRPQRERECRRRAALDHVARPERDVEAIGPQQPGQRAVQTTRTRGVHGAHRRMVARADPSAGDQAGGGSTVARALVAITGSRALVSNTT